MFDRKVSVPELFLIAGTRVALGVGIGLLLSARLTEDQRKSTGIALAVVGALTTIPLAMTLINRKGEDENARFAA